MIPEGCSMKGFLPFMIPFIMAALLATLMAAVLLVPVDDGTAVEMKCVQDSDCAPAGCCHPAACINSAYRPDCTDIMCTMECRQGTLDCGAGRCGCIEHSCAVVSK